MNLNLANHSSKILSSRSHRIAQYSPLNSRSDQRMVTLDYEKLVFEPMPNVRSELDLLCNCLTHR